MAQGSLFDPSTNHNAVGCTASGLEVWDLAFWAGRRLARLESSSKKSGSGQISGIYQLLKPVEAKGEFHRQDIAAALQFASAACLPDKRCSRLWMLGTTLIPVLPRRIPTLSSIRYSGLCRCARSCGPAGSRPQTLCCFLLMGLGTASTSSHRSNSYPDVVRFFSGYPFS